MSKLFALLFTISLSVALFYWVSPKEQNSNHSIQHKSNPPIQQKAGLPSMSVDIEALSNNDNIIMYSAMGSSLFSLLGFFFSLRSNRKESRLMDLKLEREGLELEKLRTELEQLKNV